MIILKIVSFLLFLIGSIVLIYGFRLKENKEQFSISKYYENNKEDVEPRKEIKIKKNYNEKKYTYKTEETILSSLLDNNKNNDNVVELYKTNYSTEEIAKKMNISEGEVRIILQLNNLR